MMDMIERREYRVWEGNGVVIGHKSEPVLSPFKMVVITAQLQGCFED